MYSCYYSCRLIIPFVRTCLINRCNFRSLWNDLLWEEFCCPLCTLWTGLREDVICHTSAPTSVSINKNYPPKTTISVICIFHQIQILLREIKWIRLAKHVSCIGEIKKYIQNFTFENYDAGEIELLFVQCFSPELRNWTSLWEDEEVSSFYLNFMVNIGAPDYIRDCGILSGETLRTRLKWILIDFQCFR
jgi:hypothetical protein